MATNTTNYGLIKPGYSDAADIEDINDNMDAIDATLDAKDRSLATVNTGDTAEANIASGNLVYVRGHTTLAEGLYQASAAITSGGTLSLSNLTSLSLGGLLKDIIKVKTITHKDNLSIPKWISSGNVGQCHYTCGETDSSLLLPGYTLLGVINTQLANASSNGNDSQYGVVQHAYASSSGYITYRIMNTHPGTSIKVKIFLTLLYVKNGILT